MKKDRFLTGILIGIGALIIMALILFFVRQGRVTYVDESQPTGVLQNYFLALQKRDYTRAYGYLADQPGRPSLDQFRQSFLGYQSDAIATSTVEVGDAIIDQQDQTATVQVTLLNGSPDPFGSTSRNSGTASLVRQDGAWKIIMAPYPYWSSAVPFEAPTKALPTPSAVPTSAAP
jgi:hypothetical protein